MAGPERITCLAGIRLPHYPIDSFWDITFSAGPDSVVNSITPHDGSLPANGSCRHGDGALLTPPLCHAHIHLDKPFLLSTPPHSSLPPPTTGSFAEAMSLTRQAKSSFTRPDLLRRGRRLLRESLRAGVTACRAFVEVDPGVGTLCLDVGLELKREWGNRGIDVQICAFAQERIYGSGLDIGPTDSAAVDGDDGGREMRRLMVEAAARDGVDVLGSAPYVEATEENSRKNVNWLVELASKHDKLIDFHLDYFLEEDKAPLVWRVIEILRQHGWGEPTRAGMREKQATFGHCSRLTLFQRKDWQSLRDAIGDDLSVGFVGLPTSDLFMMGRPASDPIKESTEGGGERVRGTLQIPQIISEYNIQAAIGINNVGNAFTPWGSCDPLGLASLGIGIYHAGTGRQWELLFECVGRRARQVIGLGDNRTARGDVEEIGGDAHQHGIQVGDTADFVLWRGSWGSGLAEMAQHDEADDNSVLRRTIQELVCDPPEIVERTVIRGGLVVAQGGHIL
ncbi:MAG: hypothetical protein M4579_004036 [Chaenotheca gracillima]|nr:MAG: hypothetical protein M4579_004036 [Chaenotheca gracillima]